MDTASNQSNFRLLGWVVFSTGILYYCFAYLLRVYPSVVEPDLMRQFSISAQGLGFLTSFYYFAYAPLQLPVGLAVDRIGVRRSLLFACIVGTLGSYLFAQTQTFNLALVGRFLVGFGSAFAYVTALKIASVWLPKRYFATATGAVTGFGMVAAAVTDISLTDIVHKYSHHTAMFIPSIIGVVLLALIFLLVKDRKAEGESEEGHAVSFGQLREFLSKIARNPQMWLIGFVGAVLYLPATVFLDLWAIPYLEHTHGFSKYQAAYGVSVMLAGWILSSFSTGIISDKIRSRKLPLTVGMFGALIVCSILLYVPGLSTQNVFILLFLFGAFSGPHPLCFTLSKENYTNQIAGTAVAFANFIIMMGGFIFQPLVGKFLDILSDGNIVNGIHMYTGGEYTMALSIMPIGLVMAGVCLLFIKETAK